MNKSAALERLTALESEAAALRKIIEQPEEAGLCLPEVGSEASVIQGDGTFSNYVLGSDPYDSRAIAHGNAWKSESVARKASALKRKYNFYLQACFQADQDAGEWSEERGIGIFLSEEDWEFFHFTTGTDSVCVHTVDQAIEACRLLDAWQAKEDAK